MVARKKPDAAAEAQAVFKEIDADGDGKLNAEEVKKHKGTSDKLIAMFKKYDKNGDGTMSKQEMTGVFKALDKKLSDVEIEVAFSSADRNSDGKIDVEEFIQWITGTTGKGDGINARSRMQEEFAKMPDAADDEGDWRHCIQYFDAFAGKDKVVSGAEWAKFCKDCGFIDKKFQSVDADTIFAKVIDRGSRKMNSDQFKSAVRFVAQKKACSVNVLQEKIAACGGPSMNNVSKAEATRFHDDKSTYTGVKALEHDEAGVGGRSAARKDKMEAAGTIQADENEDDWDATLKKFTAFAGKDMDGAEFAKLCRDTQLFDKKFVKEDVDSIFAKVCEKGKRRIGPDQFKDAVRNVAKKKGCSVSVVQRMLAESAGPILNATKAEANKFHDDKNLYTGVHAAGGPSLIDKGAWIDDNTRK